ncbi:MAG: FMN reductase [Candidatus Parcubacteria bacterium]|nr:MAG: FMN reductase [Candidatus Parcubacteria bacterium]
MIENQLNIKIILGSTRENRFSDKVGDWIFKEIIKHEKVKSEIIDLRFYNLPFYDETKVNNDVNKFKEKIREADGFIIITPEYNHGPTGVMKNAIDWCYEEWNYKPVAFIGYGSVGAARSIEQLRLICLELRMIPIRNSVNILGNRYYAFQEGKLDLKTLFDENISKVHELIHELLWLTEIMKQARQFKNKNT